MDGRRNFKGLSEDEDMVFKIEISIGLKLGLELGNGKSMEVLTKKQEVRRLRGVERRKLYVCLRAGTKEMKCMKASSSSSSRI